MDDKLHLVFLSFELTYSCASICAYYGAYYGAYGYNF